MSILKKVAANMFNFIEDVFPKFSYKIGYISKKEHPSTIDGFKKIIKPTKWNHEKYISSLSEIYIKPIEEVRHLLTLDQIESTFLATSNFELFGHIKSPVNSLSKKSIIYRSEGRLPWGDTYPQPFSLKQFIPGNIIFIPNIENYYHLLIDYIIPGCALAVNFPQDLDRRITFVTQREVPILNFFKDALNKYGFLASIKKISIFDHIRGDCLLMGHAAGREPGANYCYSEELEMLFPNLTDSVHKNLNAPFVYVKRSNTPRRRLINENKLIHELKRRGFYILDSNFDNYLEQISVFSKAKFIISVHGSALANLIWSKDSTVLEIFPSNIRPSHILNISSMQGLSYNLHIGGNGDRSEDFSVDLDKLFMQIDEIKRATEN